MRNQEGWKYLDDAAMRVVLEKTLATAEATAKWFKEMVEAQLKNAEQPLAPAESWQLVNEILGTGNSYGFVLDNYEQLAKKILFLLEFEKLRKAKNSSQRKLRK